MAVVGKFMTHDNGVNSQSKVVEIFYTGLCYMPLLAEPFVEIGLRASKPRVDDDIEPFICCVWRR